MIQKIEAAFKACNITESAIADTWREIVERESFTRDPKSVEILSDYLEGQLASLGYKTRQVKFEDAGPLLIGEMGEGDKSEGVILTGHMDTVFKTGTLAERPFTLDGDKVYGPGVLDMKGGINLIIYITKMLKELGYTKPIKVIICGDEEHGHAFSDAVALMKAEAKGYKCAFNLETGLINNGITVARKGRIGYTIKVHGKSAHAGANFDDGISAIYELANILVKINALNDKYEKVTFSAGVIKGGTIVNAVPDYAELELDIRYMDVDTEPKINADIKSICENPTVPGATTELNIDSSFPPFMDTINGKFYEIVSGMSETLGFGETTPMTIGGASDASYLTEAGVPVLCSMGTKGEWNHTTREYALLSSAVERIKLITASILEIENQTL